MADDMPEIKTGNGVDRDLAATANDRLKKTVTEIRSLNSTIEDLKTSLGKFSTSSDNYSKKLIYLTWGLVALTVILVGMTYVLIRDAKNQVSSQNNIALNSSFFNNANTGIISAIENGQPILVENKGKYTDTQLDNYLGSFDTVESSFDGGLLSESDLCDSFSYFIKITVSNLEISNYVAQQQKQDPEFFTSLETLANTVAKSTNPNCK